jgi:hypothetical protein
MSSYMYAINIFMMLYNEYIKCLYGTNGKDTQVKYQSPSTVLSIPNLQQRLKFKTHTDVLVKTICSLIFDSRE